VIFQLILTGTRPMIQHNGRLANPLDPYTRALKELTGKRRKTDDDLVNIMQVEARGSCWENEDALLGIPNAAVWRCIYDAAKAYKRGEDVKRAVVVADETMPLLFDGSTVSCDVWLKEPEHIFYRPAKVTSRTVMRARPIIPVGWVSTHEFDLWTDVIDPRDLVPILERAGRLVGLGDWRPTYGTFTVAVESS
jgi:hypothetical protein